MTLSIYVRCRDGCILINDRQVSAVTGGSREKQKVCLSQRGDYALAGAGEGLDVDFIFDRLSNDNSVNGGNVRQKLHALIQEYYSPFSGVQTNVFCILVAWENGRSVPYEIKISGERPSIVPLSAPHLSVGIRDAWPLANYLIKKINYRELPWEAAVQCAIAVMKEVSKEIDGVGRLEEFGFDIIVFLDDGSIRKKLNYRGDSASIGVKFDTTEDISSEFVVQEIGDIV